MKRVAPVEVGLGVAASRCVVGDFERQAALILGCNELEVHFPEVMVGIVGALAGSVPLVGIVENEEQRRLVVTRLCDAGVPAHRMHFLRLAAQAMWVRDYGPHFVRLPDGQIVVLDADYLPSGSRPECDRMPEDVARLLKLPLTRVPAFIEGGNLLSNGRGLGLTTYGLLQRNAKRGLGPADVGYLLNRYYGFEQAIALEALAGEETAHVDLFAAFTSADTVVVGQYDPDVDRKNAELLDRNAERLASVTTGVGRLKVERIPMPTNADGIWRSYTNVIFANGTLLVPVYNDVNDPGRERALETYARLLPGWEVKTIDATRLIRNRGALRCVSVNVPWLFEAFETGQGRRVA